MTHQRRKLTTSADALIGALRHLGLTDQVKRILIGQCWERAVGTETAKRAQPDSFSRGVLQVKASSAAWQNELTFLKEQIRARLNEELGANTVRGIRVIAGAIRRHERKPARKPVVVKPTPEHEAFAAACCATIADPEVRAQVERLIYLHLRER